MNCVFSEAIFKVLFLHQVICNILTYSIYNYQSIQYNVMYVHSYSKADVQAMGYTKSITIVNLCLVQLALLFLCPLPEMQMSSSSFLMRVLPCV